MITLWKGLGDDEYIGNDGNFEISILQSPTNVQFISQNPENQIVSDSIDGELAFSLECHYTNSDLIQGKLLKLKNELPFYTAGSRHPATLSGGEMELLNIITGFSTSPEFIIIDDSLSFINDTMKRKVIQKIQDNIQNKKQIVLWFTSEITDLQFSQSQWELSLSSFSKRIPSMKSVYPVKKIKAGKLNLELNSLSFKYNAERKIFDGINIGLLIDFVIKEKCPMGRLQCPVSVLVVQCAVGNHFTHLKYMKNLILHIL